MSEEQIPEESTEQSMTYVPDTYEKPVIDELDYYSLFFLAIPDEEFGEKDYALGAKLTDAIFKVKAEQRLLPLGLLASEEEVAILEKVKVRLTSYNGRTYKNKIYVEAALNDIRCILDWMTRIRLRVEEHCPDLLATAKVVKRLL